MASRALSAGRLARRRTATADTLEYLEYIGLDLHKRDSRPCLPESEGKLVEGRIRTDPAHFSEVLGGQARARSGPLAMHRLMSVAGRGPGHGGGLRGGAR